MCNSCAEDAKRAYFAGLLDGEGTVGIRTVHKTNSLRVSFALQIAITNCDRSVLDEASAIWGGGVYVQQRRGKPVYRWAASRRPVDFLRDVLPYVRIKRQQVLIALALVESIERCGRVVPPEEWDYRRQLQAECRNFNQRRYHGEYITPLVPQIRSVGGGCLSCGCVLQGGSPTDDHDDDANITIGDLTEAANAPACACGLNQAAQNIVDSLAVIQAKQAAEARELEELGEDVVLKALVPGVPKRYVLGVAYAADDLDGHKEFTSAAEVEKAAWNYARNHRRIGFYHVDGTETHADLVESYIYRGPDWVTTDIDGQEQVIKAGDWLIGGILDEPGFDLVVKRKADGWSMDGAARRRKYRIPRSTLTKETSTP